MTRVNITIPCYNEEKIIGPNIDQVIYYCQKNLSEYQWQIIIADNGSKDKTFFLAQKKAIQYSNLKCFSLKTPGKGAAIKEAWLNYPAEINIFMDADLATDLTFLPQLIKPLKNKKADLIIGSRRQKQSQTQRSWWRSFLSNIYNFIIKLLFNLEITDASCGFKAASQELIKNIVPQTKNDGFFFDTELLILSHYYKFVIKEIPVIWQDEKERKTKVKIIRTCFNYLKELIKLKKRIIKMPGLK